MTTERQARVLRGIELGDRGIESLKVMDVLR
jgi:hypothetical protein